MPVAMTPCPKHAEQFHHVSGLKDNRLPEPLHSGHSSALTYASTISTAALMRSQAVTASHHVRKR